MAAASGLQDGQVDIAGHLRKKALLQKVHFTSR